MATIASPQTAPARKGNARFFAVMAFAMSAIIVAGFSLQLAMGRSSFAAPVAYHIHGVTFMGWVALYLAQHVSAARGNWTLHVRLGKLAYVWIAAMVATGCAIMITVARRTGGPFFFDVNEFLISNVALLLCFGGLAYWALQRQRYTGWHRRLMLVAMAMLTGPGLGRLLPLPLMIPHAWTTTIVLTFAFPLIGMIADLRRDRRIHAAYWWGTGIYAASFIVSMLLANSVWGIAITEAVIAGTPGAERPMQAYLPADFTP
ncbi:MAG: hypothetical protein KKE77_09520 [Alphaproteobacteria bacterium]|nr:hypothetical protein [Alphaproteobacteria bacterium]